MLLPKGSDVGIDLGVVRFAVLSDGTFYALRNSFKRHEASLRRAQRAMSRKVKFSNNWKKAKARVQKIQSRIPNVWRDYLHQTPQIFKNLDSWTRHRLRAIHPKHWRVGTTVYSRLRALGATHELAAQIAGGAGHWRGHIEAGLNHVLTVKYFDALGIPRLT